LTPPILRTPPRQLLQTLSKLLFAAPATFTWSVCIALISFCIFPVAATAQTPGTATVSVSGWDTNGDYGVLYITVNGFTDGTPYPNGSGPGFPAEYLTNTINLDNPYVSASWNNDFYNPVITLTAKTSGSNTNYPLSVLVYSQSLITPPGMSMTASGPTLTGGTDAPNPVTSIINPKYIIVGVTYAPPGAQSNVTYTNSVLVGNSSSLNESFTDQTSVSVSVSAGIAAWDPGGKITGTETTSYTQGSSSSSSVTINKTTTESNRVSGPANSFVGLDHDYDVIWLWLNPVLPITFPNANNPNALQWNGYGYDPNDQPGLDIFPVFVGWLNGDIPVPPDVAQVLARTWASGYIWGPGQGPGLTGPGAGTDFATILQADPFWQCDQSPSNCPTTVDLTRFTLSNNQPLIYEQAPVGGQPINQTYQLQYSNTSTQGQGTTSTFAQGFALEWQVGGLFGLGLSMDFKQSNTLTWTTSVNTSITNTSGSTAAASVTGPTCTVPTGGNTCSPEYDGAAEFSVYQDNQYGTFMFFPVRDPRYRLGATPATQKVAAGKSTTYTITTTAVDGFTGNIDLTVSGLPAGANASFSPATVAAGGSSTLTVNTSTSTPAASSTLTIKGTSGSIIINVPVTLTVQDFSVTVSPSSQSVAAGGNATYTVTTAGLNGLGFNDNVTLSVSGGLPSGATATFSPNPIAGVGSSTLTVTVPAGAAAGNYQFTVNGADGALSHSSATVTLTVLAPDFTISASPSSISILPGGCAVYTMTTTALNGFTGTISLSQSGVPSGSTAIFSPLSINGAGSSMLTVCTAGATPAGSYTITITGISGSVIHSTAVILVVQDFSLSATPGSQTVTPGTGTSYTVSTAALNGFAGSVSLSISGFPSGASATFNPTSISGTGSSTLTVTTSSNTLGGTYPLTITGTSGTVSHSIAVNLIVAAPDFTIDATPASLSVTRGSSGNYTVTISAVSGFNGAVNLSVTGLPSRTTATFTPTSITGSGTSTLRLTVQSNATRGTSTLTIKGTSGSLTHTKTVTLVIQ
jgi:VCBS repeat-containing protein